MSLYLLKFYKDISCNKMDIMKNDDKLRQNISTAVTNFMDNNSVHEYNNKFSHFVHSIKHNEPLIPLFINNQIQLFNHNDFYAYIENKLKKYRELDENELQIIANLPDDFKCKIIKLYNHVLKTIKKIVI
jgi:hypothetical protein